MDSLKWKKGDLEKSNQIYEPIQTLDTQYNPTVSTKRRNRFFIFGALLILLAVLTPMSASLWLKSRDILVWPEGFVRLDPQAPPRAPLHCGNSLEEAKARGCVFDIVTANYLHKDCPLDFADEFYYYQNGTPWTYWKDQRGTMPLTLEELADAGEYWSTAREHIVHCGFVLKRGHAVMARGDRLDSMTGGFGHSVHCVQFLLDGLRMSERELDQIVTYSTIGFLSC